MSLNDKTTVGQNRQTAYIAIVAALFGLFAFQLWYHAVRTSATIDEPVHILAAHRHLQCKDFGINPEHPPLLKLISAVPLQFMMLWEPPWDCGSKITSKDDSFAFGNQFVVENGIDRVVIPPRIAASLFSLAMALVVFLAARQMFGRWEGVVALALVAFEPNFVAHGAVVTTDMALTLTAFAFVFALYRYGGEASWKRFVIAGVAFGILLGAKHSAVILLPILFVLFVADGLIFRGPTLTVSKAVVGRTGSFAGFFLIGLLILWIFYGFQPLSIPAATEPTVSIPDYIRENGRPEMIQSTSAKIVDLIARSRVFPESYVYGLADIVATGSRNAVIFDKAYPTGQWFYFPVVFVVKTSIPLLLLVPVGLITAFVLKGKRREFVYLLVPSLWFLGMAMTSGINLGVRHILPIYPFLIVLAAAGAVALCRKLPAFRYVIALLLLFHFVTAFRTLPYNIAFSNDLWGGVDGTHKVFADGNTDWGQNLKFVNAYLAERNITDCWFVGMGNTRLKRAMLPCRIMTDNFRYWANNTIDDEIPPVIEGTVLISSRDLPPRAGPEYLPITRGSRRAMIAGSVFVYEGRFEIPLAAALSNVRRSTQFLGFGRVNEAVAEARRSVELAPEDPRPHIALGFALGRSGENAAAREALERALEIIKSNPAVFRNDEVRAKRELERISRPQ